LISELRAIVSSIVGSFRSLVWVVVLLLLMIYIVAVFFTQSITDHLVDASSDPAFALSSDEQDLRYFFGTLGRAILSLWQAMSGGMDLDALAGPLFRKISFTTGFAFASFIAFALLALMNVVTGVFVQTALLSAKDEEDNFMTSQIIALFNIAEKGGTGSGSMIGWDEIVECLEGPLQTKEWKSLGVSAEDAKYLFRLLDIDNSGEVAFEEFMGGALRLSGNAKAVDLLTVMQEGRTNQKNMTIKIAAIAEAIIDVHETVKKSQDDIIHLLADISIVRQHEMHHGSSPDMTNFTMYVATELADMKKQLKPLKLVEELFTSDDLV